MAASIAIATCGPSAADTTPASTGPLMDASALVVSSLLLASVSRCAPTRAGTAVT